MWQAKQIIQALIVLTPFMYGKSDISFHEYCDNSTDPDVLPGKGILSSGLFSFNRSLQVDRSSFSYPSAFNCTLTLTVEQGYQLLIAFREVSLRNSSLDTLTIIYDDGTKKSVLSGQSKCQEENCTGFMFESGKNSHNITFKFMTANLTVPSEFTGFAGVYTVFNTIGKSKTCPGKNRFLCLNSHCIDESFVCDSHNNCGDRSDELPCFFSKTGAIIVIAMAVLSVIIFVPLFCFLANRGTRKIIKAVTVPNRSTPLYPTANDDETTRLLTSSGPPSGCWSSTSYERRHSCNYGGISQEEDLVPSTSRQPRSVSFQDDIGKVIRS